MGNPGTDPAEPVRARRQVSPVIPVGYDVNPLGTEAGMQQLMVVQNLSKPVQFVRYGDCNTAWSATSGAAVVAPSLAAVAGGEKRT